MALPREEVLAFQLWDRFGAGESNAFGQRILAICFTQMAEPREFFYGTEIRVQHTQKFRRSFERLLTRARACDPEDMIGDALRGSQNGRVYRFMVDADPDGEYA